MQNQNKQKQTPNILCCRTSSAGCTGRVICSSGGLKQLALAFVMQSPELLIVAVPLVGEGASHVEEFLNLLFR